MVSRYQRPRNSGEALGGFIYGQLLVHVSCEDNLKQEGSLTYGKQLTILTHQLNATEICEYRPIISNCGSLTNEAPRIQPITHLNNGRSELESCLRKFGSLKMLATGRRPR